MEDGRWQTGGSTGKLRVSGTWKQDLGGEASHGHQRGKERARKRQYSEATGVWENVLCPRSAGGHLHPDVLGVRVFWQPRPLCDSHYEGELAGAPAYSVIMGQSSYFLRSPGSSGPPL